MWREGSWLLPYEQRQRWRRCRAVGGRRQRRHNFDWLDELYSAYALASLGAVIVHVNVQVVRADWTGVGYGLPGKEVAASFFFNDTATTEIYTLSLHDALPI